MLAKMTSPLLRAQEVPFESRELSASLHYLSIHCWQ